MTDLDKLKYEELESIFYTAPNKLNTKTIRKYPHKQEFEQLYEKYFNKKPYLCCTHKWHKYMQELKKEYGKVRT